MELSVIIPVHNEEHCISSLCKELEGVLSILKKEYEVIFIDDGSYERTAEKISRICKIDKNIKLVSFTRRFGLSAALAAGFEVATGETVVSMDGDLQNDPKDMGMLLTELYKGYDIVCGYRKKRHDALLSRRLSSFVANRVGMFIFGLSIHDFSTTYRELTEEMLCKI